MTEIMVDEVKEIPAGEHTGKIVGVEYTTEPYKYTRFVIQLDGGEDKIRLDFPTKITLNSGLGKFLIKMGLTLEVGKGLNIEALLLDKELTFQTINEETEKGVFARVVPTTIKMIEQTTL